MKSPNFLLRRFCFFLQVSLPVLYLACISPVQAMTSNTLSYPDLSKLASLETIVYGSARKSLPSEQRISSLEKTIFGKTHHGPLNLRVNALAAAVSGQHNLLSPPLAPELDRTNSTNATAQAPLPAPRLISEDNGYDSQSPPQARQDRIKVMLQQAMQLYSQGQADRAEIIFKNVLALDSQNSDANFNLGAIYEGRSDWQTALRYYQTALRANPDDQDTKTAVQAMKDKIAIAGKKTGQTNNTNNSLSAKDIDNLRMEVTQAANDYQKGNYDAAISKLKRVLKQAPDQADVQYALAQAYKAKGQYANARTALAQANALAPNNQEYKNALEDLDQKIANNQSFPDQYSANNSSDNNANAPTGQITPFTSTANNDSQQGWQSTAPNRFYSNNSYYTPPYSSGYSSYYPSGSMNGYAYSRYNSGGLTYRIERAAIGSLAGAAIGSMFGGYGMHSRGALTGAMIGGIFGLMSGGGRHW